MAVNEKNSMGHMRPYAGDIAAFFVLWIIFIALYWLTESAVDVLIFQKGSFLERLIMPGRGEITLRLFLTGFLSLLIALFIQLFLRRKRLFEQSLENEFKFRTLFEKSMDAIYIRSNEGYFIDVNRAMLEMLGYTREELIGKEITAIFALQEERRKFEELRGRTGSLRDYEIQLIRRDRRVIDCLISTTVQKNTRGVVIGYQGIIRDITQHKIMVNSLRESETRFRALAESIASAIFIIQRTHFIYVNPAFERMSGYSREELSTLSFWDIVHQDYKDLTRERGLARLREERVPDHYEFKIVTKEGVERWVDYTATSITFEGETVLLGAAFDITDRKCAEEELRESELRYREIFNNANDIIYTHDFEGKLLSFNNKACQVTGYTPGEIEKMSIYDVIAPEYQDFIRMMIRRKRDNRASTLFEVEILDRQGHRLALEINSRLIFKNGKPYGIQGTARDVSERRQIEETLRKSEEKYRNLVENISETLFTLDREGRVTYISPAVQQITGYRDQDLLNHVFTEFIHPKDIPALMESFQRTLHGIWEPYEFRIISAGGSTIYVRSASRPYFEKGELKGITGILTDMTREKKSEEALRRSETRFRTIFQGSAIGITVADINGRILEANPAFLRMTGYSWEELKDVSKLDLTHPEDRDEERELVENLIWGQGGRNQTDKRYIRKDGSIFWGRLTVSVMQETDDEDRFIISMVEDISERKKARMELSMEKERLAVTLRSIGDGVIATDDAGRILLINRVAEELTGWNAEEAAGRPLEEVFHIVREKTGEVCENPVKRVLSTGDIIGLANHTILVSRDGTERVIADSGAPIRDRDNRIIGVVLVFRDITRSRKLEEELIKTQKLESLGVLAGGIAHDFNNILTSILGNVSLALTRTDDDENLALSLREAQKAAWHARDLTQQLLTFSRGGSPIMKVISLSGIIREAAAFALSGSNIKSVLNIPEDLWHVNADEGQIRQVVNNLIINAKQSMPSGGVIEVTAENVLLDTPLKSYQGAPLPFTLEKGRYLALSIRDQGVGIDPDIMTRIFDPYFSTKEQGNGLGLTIAHSIIKRHDGFIHATSRPGEGSCFYIFLPATGETGRDPVPGNSEPLRGQGRILLMDDEETIRKVAGEMIRYLGYEVDFARDGDEAVTMYRRALDEARPYAAAIMDLTIPGGTGGRECMRQLLEIDPEVRAVVSSGYSNDPIMAEYGIYGFASVIAKPFSLDDLSRVLHEVLRDTQSPLK